MELGRYLVGQAGIYVCEVVDRKVSRGETFLITNGGLHHHLAASGNFGQVIRKNYPVAIGNRMAPENMETVSVVGPLCTPLDILADHMDLPLRPRVTWSWSSSPAPMATRPAHICSSATLLRSKYACKCQHSLRTDSRKSGIEPKSALRPC